MKREELLRWMQHKLAPRPILMAKSRFTSRSIQPRTWLRWCISRSCTATTGRPSMVTWTPWTLWSCSADGTSSWRVSGSRVLSLEPSEASKWMSSSTYSHPLSSFLLRVSPRIDQRIRLLNRLRIGWSSSLTRITIGTIVGISRISRMYQRSEK